MYFKKKNSLGSYLPYTFFVFCVYYLLQLVTYIILFRTFDPAQQLRLK